VRQDDVGEHRPRHESNVPLSAGRVVFDQLRPEDVGRHQVRCELDSAELEADGVGQRLDEERLGEAGHSAQQAMAAGEQTGEDFAADALLSDDRAADLGVETGNEVGGLLKREVGGVGSSVRGSGGHAQYYDLGRVAAEPIGAARTATSNTRTVSATMAI